MVSEIGEKSIYTGEKKKKQITDEGQKYFISDLSQNIWNHMSLLTNYFPVTV